jgi:predicted SAM-dependent methyltransferase
MKLNLGCGDRLRDGYINIDNRPTGIPFGALWRDVLRGLPFSDEVVDEIYSENFLEHIPQTEVIWMMNEMHRVMKPGGTMTHLVPRAGSTNFYQDPTHLSHWIEDTLTYFRKDNPRNLYYDGAIRPWTHAQCTDVNVNSVMTLAFTK